MPMNWELCSDEDVKARAREAGVSLRGRFSREKVIERIKEKSPVERAAAAVETKTDANGHPSAHERGVFQKDGEESEPLSARPAKKVPVKVAYANPEENKQPYDILGKLQAKHHPRLEGVSIALVWQFGWKADSDTGTAQLFKVDKISPVFRLLTGFDFLFFLNHEVWHKKAFKVKHMQYVLDECLERCAPDLDRNGHQKVDENDRKVWLKLKPTVEMFPAIVQRHGFVTAEALEIAKAAQEFEDLDRPLFAGLE